jgi:hypothetical protein
MNLRMPAWLLGCLVLVQSGLAAPDGPPAGSTDEGANPYAVISDRNVFHLNPIPPPAAPEAATADLPVVKLSGFIEIGHKMRALFSSLPKQGKGEPIYYNLAEGEKTGILELVRIHYHEGAVDVINSGTPMTLNVKDDGLAGKVPVAAAAAEHATPRGAFPGVNSGASSQQPGVFSGHRPKPSGFPPGTDPNNPGGMPTRPFRRAPVVGP